MAEWLEQNGGARDENASRLAYHYIEAVRLEDADLAWAGDDDHYEALRQRALEWLRRAAALSISRYAVDDALAILHEAVELERDTHAQVELWKRVAEAHELRYEGGRSREALERALSLLEDDPAEQAEISSLLAIQTAKKAGMWAHSPVTRELVEGWIERALGLSPPASPARVRALVARVTRNAGSIDDAIAAAEQLGDPELASFALGARASDAIERMRYMRRLRTRPNDDSPCSIGSAIPIIAPAFTNTRPMRRSANRT